MNREAPTLLFHDIQTNGICYADLAFDLSVLPDALLPWVPLFGRVLLESGTEREDEVRLSQRISRLTGGIRTAFVASQGRDGNGPVLRLVLRGKALEDKIPHLFAIFEDILTMPRLDNRERFRKTVLEQKARMEQTIIPSGHQFINTRLRSAFNRAGFVSECLSGLSQVLFLRDLAGKVDEDWPSVLGSLRRIMGLLVNGKRSLVNVTVPARAWNALERQIYGLTAALPPGEEERSPVSPAAVPAGKNEGFGIPASVYYVGKGMNLHDKGYVFHGSARVVSRYLRNGWLWDQVRVRGGAYGAFCLYDGLSGVVTLLSYRDPRFSGTLRVFDGAGDFLENTPLSREERVKAIIGAIGEEDSYLLPDARGYTSMIRYLAGVTDEYRQAVRGEIFSTSAEHFREFGRHLKMLRDFGIVSVLGPEGGIREASEREKLGLAVSPVL